MIVMIHLDVKVLLMVWNDMEISTDSNMDHLLVVSMVVVGFLYEACIAKLFQKAEF